MTLAQAPKTKPAQTVKQCICCGRKLSAAIRHAETALGPIGPECEKKANVIAALERLHAYDLGELAGGELRLDGVTTGVGTFTFPTAKFEALKKQAADCGVRLAWRPDFTARQFVVTLRADSVSELLAKVDTMLTLSNPATGTLRVPVRVGGVA